MISAKIRQNIPEILKYLLIVVFIIIFSYLSFARHDSLKTYMNDLGAIEQVIWNTLNGNFFEGSSVMLAGSVDYNYLGAHFGIILILLTPFYWLFSSPKTLLFIQVFLVGLAGLPLYWLAKEKLKSSWAGMVFLISYLSYPAIQNALLYDFHEVVLAAPFTIFALYFLEKNKKVPFVVFAVLACLCQEHIALIFFMVGLYIIFVKKQKRFGLKVAAAALIWFLLLLGVIMPALSTSGEPELIKAETEYYPSRYAWLGGSLTEVVKNLFTNPSQTLSYIFQYEKIRYLFYLLMPVFGLAVFSPMVLVALPIIGINLLSSINMPYNLYFYHSAIITPMIMVAAILALKKHFLGSKYLHYFLAAIVVASLTINYIFSLTPWTARYSLEDFRPTAHAKKISEIKELIPDEASLSIQHNLGSHFTQRRNIFRFPLSYNEAEYVLLDYTDPYYNNREQIFHFDYSLQMPRNIWFDLTVELINSPDYGVIFFEDGFLLFQKGAARNLNDQAHSDIFEIIDDGDRL
ncbi:MAG: DUF2079 domain-containing protein [Patescibacteria group bacterium]